MSALTRRTFLGAYGAALAAQPKRPNIVLIMADDLGFSDIGCYGSEIETPNLDQLARSGVRFTQFFNTARCCPTRAALLTGVYNHQAGVGHMVADRGHPSYQGYLNNRCVTIAEALREAGYRTLMSGKWHVGEQRPHWPTDRGFDRYFGLVTGADNYFRPVRQMALEDQPWKPASDDFYMTDAFTDYAVRVLEEQAQRSEPFFLYLACTAPHWPLHALPSDIARYRGRYKQGWDKLRADRHARQIRMGVVERKWPLTPRDEGVPAWDSLTPEQQDDFDLRMAIYAAQIHSMDRGIGRVVAQLRRRGQLDNTLVMFLADNGGCAEENLAPFRPDAPGPAESFTSYGKPWANASNTPFRLYKHWLHEGGIATPFVASWPGVIRKRGSLHHQHAHVIDLMATCVDAAGAPYPRSYRGRDVLPLEGKTLLPTFQGKPRRTHEWLFWEHEGNRAVRAAEWKLVSRYPGNWELYNLGSDRTEMRDLASSEPERVRTMAAQYDRWAERCGVVPWRDLQPAAKKKS